jgi:mannose-1-phosphate guanylyltransferase
LKKTSPDDAYVLLNDYNWSDPGTLYALKEALQESDDSNVTKGLVYSQDTTDSLIFNYEKDKLVTTIGLSGFVVVNMDDTLIVVHKSNVPKIKELVNKLKEDKDLKKYI